MKVTYTEEAVADIVQAIIPECPDEARCNAFRAEKRLKFSDSF